MDANHTQAGGDLLVNRKPLRIICFCDSMSAVVEVYAVTLDRVFGFVLEDRARVKILNHPIRILVEVININNRVEVTNYFYIILKVFV